MINVVMGIVGGLTSITALAIFAHWWIDSGKDWMKSSTGRSLMLLLASIAISSGVHAIVSLHIENYIYVILQLIATILLLVAVVNFGYDRYAVQHRHKKKGKH